MVDPFTVNGIPKAARLICWQLAQVAPALRPRVACLLLGKQQTQVVLEPAINGIQQWKLDHTRNWLIHHRAAVELVKRWRQRRHHFRLRLLVARVAARERNRPRDLRCHRKTDE
jgi:hypothetical protein